MLTFLVGGVCTQRLPNVDSTITTNRSELGISWWILSGCSVNHIKRFQIGVPTSTPLSKDVIHADGSLCVVDNVAMSAPAKL